MVVERILENGVIMHKLEVEPNIAETQDIFNMARVLEDVCVYDAYNSRVENSFVGTYEAKISRIEDYNRFINFLKLDSDDHRKSYRVNLRNRLERLYIRGFFQDFNSYSNKYDETYHAGYRCKCSLCLFRLPTFEEWLSGKYQEDEKRIVKLGKKLSKIGYDKRVIDFYSQQVKTEKSVFLTVSDLPQHIAGMSNYVELGEWDGFGGSSCQDSRHDEHYCINLAGSLHDDKLFIGMLHYKMNDLEDMNGKLKARVLFRYITVDGVPSLISTLYYGNNETKNELHEVVSKLEEVEIYSQDYRLDFKKETEVVFEDANGYYEMIEVDEIEICETIEEEISVNCPMCDGDGDYRVFSYRFEEYVHVECPACNGDGSVYSMVYIEVDETRTVSNTTNIRPYAEGYKHRGYEVMMEVAIESIISSREKRVESK